MIKCIEDKTNQDFIPESIFQYNFKLSSELVQDLSCCMDLNWREEIVEILTQNFKMELETLPFFTTKVRKLKDFL